MGLKDWWFKLKGSPLADVIKRKHRFVVMDTDTFKEKFSFQLSGINIFVVTGVTIIVLILLTTVLIAFTPMREWIPGYTNTHAVEQTYSNAKKLDSLQVQLENQEWLIATLQAVLRGDALGDTVFTGADSSHTLSQQAVVYRHVVEDSLLRAEVEREDSRYQVKSQSAASQSEGQAAISHLFYAPLKGNVLTPFGDGHRGVDIGAELGHTICATYGGTVVFAGFTAEQGQVLTVQHPGNVVSVYSNCASLLKKQGDVVRTGEPVGFVGNGSRHELGPYLHFELWMGGAAVNPVDYISF